MKALIYCKHQDGELCNFCAFGRYAPHCSDILADAAVDRIRELVKETKALNLTETIAD